jgi:heme-degrading monooxygenase HmoA
MRCYLYRYTSIYLQEKTEMIIRQWIFKTAIENAARFEEFERKEGLPMVSSQAGCVSVELIRRRAEESSELAEYSMLSRWESWEHVQNALNSTSWKEEVALFLTQGFGVANGSVAHYEVL